MTARHQCPGNRQQSRIARPEGARYSVAPLFEGGGDRGELVIPEELSHRLELGGKAPGAMEHRDASVHEHLEKFRSRDAGNLGGL